MLALLLNDDEEGAAHAAAKKMAGTRLRYHADFLGRRVTLFPP
jgi:hypothetical protein